MKPGTGCRCGKRRRTIHWEPTPLSLAPVPSLAAQNARWEAGGGASWGRGCRCWSVGAWWMGPLLLPKPVSPSPTIWQRLTHLASYPRCHPTVREANQPVIPAGRRGQKGNRSLSESTAINHHSLSTVSFSLTLKTNLQN